MKNKFFSLVSLVIVGLTLACSSSLNAAEVANGRKKIVVLDFKAPSSASAEAKRITEELIATLAKDPALDVWKGSSESADYTIVGNISEGSSNLIINLEILDPKTSKIIYAKKLTLADHLQGADSENVSEIAVCQIANIISETAFPIKIDSVQGAYVYLDLNHGASSYIKTGMKVEVLIPSAYSVDPSTGEVVKGSEYSVGELKITEIQPKLAKAQIIRYSAPIEAGAFCRTIPECR